MKKGIILSRASVVLWLFFSKYHVMALSSLLTGLFISQGAAFLGSGVSTKLVFLTVIIISAFRLVSIVYTYEDERLNCFNSRHILDRVDEGYVLAFGYALYIVSIVLLLFLNDVFITIFSSIFIVLTVLYSAPGANIRRFPLFSNILRSLFYSSLPFILGYGQFNSSVLALAIPAFFVSLGIVSFDDIRTQKGDESYGIRSLGNLVGLEDCWKISLLIILVGILILVGLSTKGYFMKDIQQFSISMFIWLLVMAQSLYMSDGRWNDILVRSSFLLYLLLLFFLTVTFIR